MTRNRLFRGLWWLLCGIGLPVLAYGAASLIGSLWTANPDWREPASGVTIHVVSNGYHTGIVLPASAAGIDLSLTFRPTDLPDPNDAGDWLLFGWGDRDFYRNTPTWDELEPRTALVALLGSGQTLLHVDHLKSPAEVPDARALRVTPDQYRRLVTAIAQVARRDADRHPIAFPGYGRLDVFYEAEGRYSALNTCNVWTAEILAAAGVKVGRWTPFSGGVMWWFSPSPEPRA